MDLGDRRRVYEGKRPPRAFPFLLSGLSLLPSYPVSLGHRALSLLPPLTRAYTLQFYWTSFFMPRLRVNKVTAPKNRN